MSSAQSPEELNTLTDRELRGQLARSLRVLSGLTQTEVAEAAGCDRSFVSNIEAGRDRSSMRVALVLAARLPEVLAPPTRRKP